MLTGPPELLLSVCTIAKSTKGVPHPLSVSRTGLTAVNTKKSFAAIRLVEPLIQGIGPFGTVSAAETVRILPVALRAPRRHTNKRIDIRLTTNVRSHVYKSMAVIEAESMKGRTGTDMMTIVDETMITKITSMPLGAPATINTKTIESRLIT